MAPAGYPDLGASRPSGAPAHILVNGTLIARGDVVVIDDELGVRVSEIVAGPDSSMGRRAPPRMRDPLSFSVVLGLIVSFVVVVGALFVARWWSQRGSCSTRSEIRITSRAGRGRHDDAIEIDQVIDLTAYEAEQVHGVGPAEHDAMGPRTGLLRRAQRMTTRVPTQVRIRGDSN